MPDLRKIEDLKNTSLIGGTLVELVARVNTRNILVFGSGDGGFEYLLAYLQIGRRIVSYDINAQAIDLARQKLERVAKFRRELGRNPLSLEYTSEKPREQFDAVACISVLHENPDLIIPEVVGLTKPSGRILILDYDMKGTNQENFFKCWGHQGGERAELQRLGKDGTYRMHTSFDLTDCASKMNALGVRCEFSQGKMKSMFRKENPTEHFIYLGRKT